MTRAEAERAVQRIRDQVLVRLGLRMGVIDPRFDKSMTEVKERIEQVDTKLIDENGGFDVMYVLSKAQRLAKKVKPKPVLTLVPKKS
jgi:hypothetical protein